MGDLVFNIEMGVLHGVAFGALTPFVTAGFTTQAKATEMADTVVNVVTMLHGKHVSLAEVGDQALRGAVYDGLQPYVRAGDISDNKAAEASDAVASALGMFAAAAKAPKTAP